MQLWWVKANVSMCFFFERENVNVCEEECCLEKMFAYLRAAAVISTVFSLIVMILERKEIYFCMGNNQKCRKYKVLDFGMKLCTKRANKK